MGKREAYNQSNYHVDQYQAPIARTKKSKNKKKGSPCMQSFSRNPTRGVIEQLAVPWWEKQFCLKIGLFSKWEDFLDAKKYSQYYATSTIKNWDDSAAEKAFRHAKNRFLARLGGNSQADDMNMDPNLYIDEIKWDEDEQVDPHLLEELKSAKLPKDYGDHVDPDPIPIQIQIQIQIQDIKATGWDIDVQQLSQSNVLTGLIVGS